MIHRRQCLMLLVGSVLIATGLRADGPATKPASKPSTQPATAAVPDLKDFRTVATAIAAQIKSPESPVAAQPGYFGIAVSLKAGRGIMVDHVDPQSPAATAGVAVGDQVLKINGEEVIHPYKVAETLL